jgi:cyclic pyranopterin phosphate synthase
MVVELSHLDKKGRARMVDVSGKPDTVRTAVAVGSVEIAPETARLISEDRIAKGNVFAVARIAGIMAAKNTPHLIPMCHTIPLTNVEVELELKDGRVEIRASASAVGKTGVEMEALTAVAVAALTVYDMCKAVDRTMRITDTRLVSTAGGKSEWRLE